MRSRFVQLGNQEIWAVEIKRNLAPAVSKGFHSGCEDLQPTQKILIYPGKDVFRAPHGVTIMGIRGFIEHLSHFS